MPEEKATNPNEEQATAVAEPEEGEFAPFDPKAGEDAMKKLADMNRQRFGPAPGEAAKEESSVEDTESGTPADKAKAEEEPGEEEKGSKESEPGEWLVKGKFRDTPEGRVALVDENKYLQGRMDRIDADNRRIQDEARDGLTLIKLIKSDPEMAKAMDTWIGAKEAGLPAPLGELKEPSMPENADAYEIFTPGSSANKYLLDLLTYNREAGKREALQLVTDLKTEQANRDKIAENRRNERSELIKRGLSDTEIDRFYAFMDDPEHQNLENAVAAWRALDSESKGKPSNEKGKEVKPKDKTISAVSKQGKTPEEEEPVAEAKKKLVQGIMRHSTGQLPDPFNP